MLSDKELATAFLEEMLPKPLLDVLELDSLTYGNTSYITAELDEIFSDVVMNFKLKSGENCVVSLLLEHKSYVDEHAVLQILRYLAEAYHAQAKAGKKLHPIIPVLYYHNSKKWEFRQLKEFFRDFPAILQSFIPSYQTLFISLNDLDDEKLTQLSNSMLSSALVLQRYYKDPEEVTERINQIMESLKPYWSKNFAYSILLYLFNITEFKFEDFQKQLVDIPENVKDKIMSTYDLIKKEGFSEGVEEERTKAVLNAFDNNIDLKTIQIITGQSVEEINKILKANGRKA